MNLVLVDASYNSFYRFFATMRWYSLAHKDEFKKYKDDPEYDWNTNEIFREKYEKMYFESIEKLLKKDIDENTKMIFCQDASQSTLWRHKLIKSEKKEDQYKGERPDLEAKYNFKTIFKTTYNKIIPKTKKFYQTFQLKFPETEADDIIATICMYLKDKQPNQNIIIVSGDDDFTQLGREKVSILNFRKKKLIKFKDDEPKEKLRLKIINGDKSDNIPSIFPKSRKEVPLKVRKLVKESEKEMNKFLKDNCEINKRFKLNQKLIDFNFIPKKIQKPIVSQFKKLIF